MARARARSKGASAGDRGDAGAASSGTTGRKLRCAIYTRKSTEEGLDQAFNSLDAQREACAAYVMSQTHEGWSLLPDRYDDGGWSGGNLERPALTRLLADVQAGRVDVIVVYKVDRLTRALAGFAKIVDVLDAAGASFVSVTQAFNTTTSMGRLTLNVLLSFAQFEREVIAERVRDKIAASKKKGMWMGGNVPLGYDVQARKLVVNEPEAATVRHIYERYLALGSVPALLDELGANGVVTKVQHQRSGAVRGGIPFARGSLYHLLANRTYLGEVAYQGQVYPGEHSGILDGGLWEQVQAQLASNASDRSNPTNAKCPSLLAGLVYDEQGRKLSASHAVKGSKRYRYYITHAGQLRDPADKQLRVPAGDLERAVLASLVERLRDRDRPLTLIGDGDHHASMWQHVSERLAELTCTLPAMTRVEQRRLLLDLELQVIVASQGGIAATLSTSALTKTVGLDGYGNAEKASERITLQTSSLGVVNGSQHRLVLGASITQLTGADERLLELVVKAHIARDQLERGQHDVALSSENGSQQHLARVARLAYLSPAIVAEIVAGTPLASLNSRALIRMAELPLIWTQQQDQLLGRNV